MPKSNAFLTTTDDLRHTYEQVFWGRQLTGNGVEPEPSAMGPWQPDPATPDPGLNGEVLGPEPATASPYISAQLESGQVIEGEPVGNVHDHADFYGTIWGDGGAAAIEGPSVEAPQIDAPAISPPDAGDDLEPGF